MCGEVYYTVDTVQNIVVMSYVTLMFEGLFAEVLTSF